MSLQNITDFGYNLTARLESIAIYKNIEAECTDEGIKAECTDEGIEAEYADEGIEAECTDEGIKAECTDDGIKAECTDDDIKAEFTDDGIKAECTDEGNPDVFVVVSVDDQQWQGSPLPSGDELYWTADHLLQMRASSRIKIEVFSKTLVSGEKHLLACSITRVIDLFKNGGHFWTAEVSGVANLCFVPYRAQDTPESDALAPHLLFDKLSDRIVACTSVPEGGDEGSQKVDHWVQSLARAAQRTSDLIELLDISDPTVKFYCLITISVCENLKGKVPSLSKPVTDLLADAMMDLDDILWFDTQCPFLLPKVLNSAYRLGVMSMRVSVLIDECVCSSTTRNLRNADTIMQHAKDIKALCQDIMEKLNTALNIDTRDIVKNLQHQSRRDKILQWLDAPDPSRTLIDARGRHHPDTCSWFLNGKQFLDWKETPGSVLWVYGPPGCGKTVLSSTTIDNSVLTAYFFFEKGKSAFQQHYDFIRSLIKQLLVRCELRYDLEVSTFWQPSLECLYSILRQLLANFERVYVVIDALDECTEAYTLLDWIQSFISWEEFKARVHLLVTSRDKLPIQDYLEFLSTIQVYMGRNVVDPDIRTFIDYELKSERPTKKWSEEQRNAIQADVLEGSKGIFRVADSFLQKVKACHNKRDLNRALEIIRNGDTSDVICD